MNNSKNRVLMVSAAANMIQQFNKRNILILQQLGFEVYVATNFVNFGSMSSKENCKLINWLNQNGIEHFQVDFKRGLGDVKTDIKAYKKIKKLFGIMKYRLCIPNHR